MGAAAWCRCPGAGVSAAEPCLSGSEQGWRHQRGGHRSPKLCVPGAGSGDAAGEPSTNPGPGPVLCPSSGGAQLVGRHGSVPGLPILAQQPVAVLGSRPAAAGLAGGACKKVPAGVVSVGVGRRRPVPALMPAPVSLPASNGLRAGFRAGFRAASERWCVLVPCGRSPAGLVSMATSVPALTRRGPRPPAQPALPPGVP